MSRQASASKIYLKMKSKKIKAMFESTGCCQERVATCMQENMECNSSITQCLRSKDDRNTCMLGKSSELQLKVELTVRTPP